MPSATQTRERPSHSVGKRTSGLVPQEDTRVIDSTSMTQRTNQLAILQQVNQPINNLDYSFKSNNKRTAIDQLDHSSSDDQNNKSAHLHGKGRVRKRRKCQTRIVSTPKRVGIHRVTARARKLLVTKITELSETETVNTVINKIDTIKSDKTITIETR